MASTGNKKSLQFSKYFPNHKEYASKVPREIKIPTKRLSRRSSTPDRKPKENGYPIKSVFLSIEPQVPINIYPETTTENIQIAVEETISVPVSTQTDEKWPKPKRRQRKHQVDQEVQTDLPDTIHTIEDSTHTKIVIHSTKTTQTDPEYVEIGRIDTPISGKYERIAPLKSSPDDERHSISSEDDADDFPEDDEKSSIAWKDMLSKELKKPPRMIVSVIGFYNELVPTYNTKDQFTLEDALRDVSKFAGSCGFLFNENNTSFVHKVVKSSHDIADISTLYGRLTADEVKTENNANANNHQPVTKSNDYNKELLGLEVHINHQTIEFQEKSKAKVRVPVVLLLINGDLFTLEHVVRALYSDISVVVIKGTGGAADLIASCLQSSTYLKKTSVLLSRRFSEREYKKLEEVIHYITKKDYMITLFDLQQDTPHMLWDKMTDGIMLAWSFEKRSGMNSGGSSRQPFGRKDIFENVGETISKYVVDIDGLSKCELFGGYQLAANLVEQQGNLLVNAVLDNRTDIIRQVVNNDHNKVHLTDDQVNELYKQTIQKNEESPRSHTASIWKKTSPEAYDALKNGCKSTSVRRVIAKISDKLLKGLCCSKIGMVTCCNACNEPVRGESDVEPDKRNTSDDLLRFAILNNDVENAGELWIKSTNPMLMALISSCYLASMASKAEELFEDRLRHELDDHSKRFAKRAEVLLEEMFEEDDKLASEALDHVTIVWDQVESPLYFGQQFNLEEFISHNAAQKDASKRLYAFKSAKEGDESKTKVLTNLKRPTYSRIESLHLTTPNFLSFVKHYWNKPLKILTAPICKFLFHKILLIASLIMFSIFLTRDLSYGSMSTLEVLVCVFVFGDFVEELFKLFRLDECRLWSPQRIFLYLFNIWNFLAIASIALYLVGYLMHLFGSEESMVHIRRIYSIALLLMYLRLLNTLLLIKRFGIIIIMIKEMLMDLMDYLVILCVVLCAAGVVYHANIYPNHDVDPFASAIGQWKIWSILKIPYWQVYGELSLDLMEGTSESDCTNNKTIWRNDPTVERCPTGDWITPVIAAFYMMLTNWLLLNIVIAMFSARFDKISERSEQKWRFYRHSVIINYEHWIPSPLNLICRPFLAIYGISRCPFLCRSCFRKKHKGSKNPMLDKQREIARKIIDKEKMKRSSLII